MTGVAQSLLHISRPVTAVIINPPGVGFPSPFHPRDHPGSPPTAAVPDRRASVTTKVVRRNDGCRTIPPAHFQTGYGGNHKPAGRRFPVALPPGVSPGNSLAGSKFEVVPGMW